MNASLDGIADVAQPSVYETYLPVSFFIRNTCTSAFGTKRPNEATTAFGTQQVAYDTL